MGAWLVSVVSCRFLYCTNYHVCLTESFPGSRPIKDNLLLAAFPAAWLVNNARDDDSAEISVFGRAEGSQWQIPAPFVGHEGLSLVHKEKQGEQCTAGETWLFVGQASLPWGSRV